MIHGYYTKLINTEKVGSLKCPNCDSQFDMQYETYCRINHAMFIPFFAGKKTASIGCGRCGSHYKPSAFPNNEQAALNFTQQTPKRWYHFIGLALLIIFVGAGLTFAYVGSQENQKRMANNLEQLIPNCVICYHKAKNVNTSMLVSRIAADTVFVYENSKATNGSAYQIDDSDNYKTRETYFLKSELKSWLETGKINDITEPQSYSE